MILAFLENVTWKGTRVMNIRLKNKKSDFRKPLFFKQFMINSKISSVP
jgi:hypothetical protein